MVSTAAEENGFEAWRQLHLRFEPELEDQKNVVLLQLHNIPPASSIEETKMKMVELRVRIAKAENIWGQALQEIQKKTAMLQILDPATRQHVAAQGTKDFTSLYVSVMNFCQGRQHVRTRGEGQGDEGEDRGDRPSRSIPRLPRRVWGGLLRVRSDTAYMEEVPHGKR